MVAFNSITSSVQRLASNNATNSGLLSRGISAGKEYANEGWKAVKAAHPTQKYLGVGGALGLVSSFIFGAEDSPWYTKAFNAALNIGGILCLFPPFAPLVLPIALAYLGRAGYNGLGGAWKACTGDLSGGGMQIFAGVMDGLCAIPALGAINKGMNKFLAESMKVGPAKWLEKFKVTNPLADDTVKTMNEGIGALSKPVKEARQAVVALEKEVLEAEGKLALQCSTKEVKYITRTDVLAKGVKDGSQTTVTQTLVKGGKKIPVTRQVKLIDSKVIKETEEELAKRTETILARKTGAEQRVAGLTEKMNEQGKAIKAMRGEKAKMLKGVRDKYKTSLKELAGEESKAIAKATSEYSKDIRLLEQNIALAEQTGNSGAAAQMRATLKELKSKTEEQVKNAVKAEFAIKRKALMDTRRKEIETVSAKIKAKYPKVYGIDQELRKAQLDLTNQTRLHKIADERLKEFRRLMEARSAAKKEIGYITKRGDASKEFLDDAVKARDEVVKIRKEIAEINAANNATSDPMLKIAYGHGLTATNTRLEQAVEKFNSSLKAVQVDKGKFLISVVDDTMPKPSGDQMRRIVTNTEKVMSDPRGAVKGFSDLTIDTTADTFVGVRNGWRSAVQKAEQRAAEKAGQLVDQAA